MKFPFLKKMQISISEGREQLFNPASYDGTLDYLLKNNNVTITEAEWLRQQLSHQIDDSRYILNNLGAHLGIGIVFAFDLIPLPLGTIGRVSWVAGARVLETYRRNVEKARVHSIGVFLIAALPWFGYAAYLLPLRRDAAELAFVLANHTWVNRTGYSYEEFIANRSRLGQRFCRWLVPLPILSIGRVDTT